MASKGALAAFGAISAFAQITEQSGKRILKKRGKVEELFEQLISDTAMRLKKSSSNFKVVPGTTLQQVRDAFEANPTPSKGIPGDQRIGSIDAQAIKGALRGTGLEEFITSDLSRDGLAKIDSIFRSLQQDKRQDKRLEQLETFHKDKLAKDLAKMGANNLEGVEALIKDRNKRSLIEPMLDILGMRIEDLRDEGTLADVLRWGGLNPTTPTIVDDGDTTKKLTATEAVTQAYNELGDDADDAAIIKRRDELMSGNLASPDGTKSGRQGLEAALIDPRGSIPAIPDPSGGRPEGLLSKASMQGRAKLFGLLRNARGGIKGQQNVGTAGATRL